jgi:hypothetical protein
MGIRKLFLPLLCIFLGGAAGFIGSLLGAPGRTGQLVGGVVGGIAYLYLDHRGQRARRSTPTTPRAPYVSPFAVRFDDVEVVVTREGAPFERVRWDDLVTVGVNIDDSPLPQPWWMLFGRLSKSAHYPSDAQGASEMLPELQRRLAGFDNAGVIRAMGMMSGGVVLWERAPARGLHQA